MKIRQVIDPGMEETLKNILANGELSPAVEKRVRVLLKDLAAKDMEMAMLDLAQLSRAVLDSEQVAPDGEYPATVVVCSEDGKALAGMCDGPEADGYCPWADQSGRLPCDGLWLSTQGWQFKVAEDATHVCPLAVVLARPGESQGAA